MTRLLERAIALPVRGGVTVERRERPPLGKLRVGGRERRPQVARALVRRDGLPVAAAPGERLEHGGVGRERVVGSQRPAVVLRHPRSREHAPAVGVGDHDLAGPAHIARGRVAGVGHPAVGQRAERGQPRERVRAAVHDRRALVGLQAHHRPRARPVPGPHARQLAPGAERARGARLTAHGAPALVGRAELVEHVGGVGRGRGAAARAVVVGSGDHGARGQQVQQRRELARQRAPLLHEPVDRPEQVDRSQVGVRHRVADRHRPVGQRRQDRVDRPAPVVVRVELAGEHDRAPVGADRRVDVVRRVLPGRGDPLPRQPRVERPPAHQRPARDRRQPGQGDRRQHRQRPAAGAEPRRRPRRPQPAEARERERHQRPRLVGRAQELQRRDVVVGEVHRAPQRRPLREARDHHHEPGEREHEQERGRPRAPQQRERAEHDRRHEQPGEHHRPGEQEHRAVAEQRPQPPAVADAEVGDPVAHQPQRFGQARRRPDRPGLLGEAQEVDAVERLHERRDHPPDRPEPRQQHRPPAEGEQRATADLAREPRVDGEQQRSQQHPRGHGRVDAAARAGDRERERRRPPPRARRAQAAMHAQQQPRERRVAEQRHGRARGEHGHVRVEQEQQAGDQVRGAARAARQRVHQPHDPPRGQAQDEPEPQPVHEPRREPEHPPEREERPHREQVAPVLAALDVPEVLGRRPRGRHVAEERDRIDVQADLRVRRRLAGTLDQRKGERQGREAREDEAIHGGPAHGADHRGASSA